MVTYTKPSSVQQKLKHSTQLNSETRNICTVTSLLSPYIHSMNQSLSPHSSLIAIARSELAIPPKKWSSHPHSKTRHKFEKTVTHIYRQIYLLLGIILSISRYVHSCNAAGMKYWERSALGMEWWSKPPMKRTTTSWAITNVKQGPVYFSWFQSDGGGHQKDIPTYTHTTAGMLLIMASRLTGELITQSFK